MLETALPKALGVEDLTIAARIDALQNRLEQQQDVFYALFWLYQHDFLYVSPSIQKILRHPLDKFENNGVVFFQNIIPERLINPIYEAMKEQTARVESHPDYLLTKSFHHVEAAVIDAERQEVPVTYHAVLLDVKPFELPSYLMFCSWIDKRNKSKWRLDQQVDEVRLILQRLKDQYIAANTEHFQFLLSTRTISAREKEVAGLIMQGHSTKSISDQLQITFNTVESHRKNLLQKLDAKNTAELVFKLSKHQVISTI